MPDLGDHGLDLPFELSNSPMYDTGDAVIAGGVVVMATVVDVPDVGPCPGLVFRFMTPAGEFCRPVLLIADDDQMGKLEPLIVSAIAAARGAAVEAQ